MTDSILDEFEQSCFGDGLRTAPLLPGRLRCVALNARDNKPCKRGSCGIVANRAYCSKHIGAARQRDDR